MTDSAAESLAQQASDPTTSQEDLATLAFGHPELRNLVAANPSAYPGLREWIAAAGLTPAPGTAAAGATRWTPRGRLLTLVAAIIAVLALLFGSGLGESVIHSVTAFTSTISSPFDVADGSGSGGSDGDGEGVGEQGDGADSGTAGSDASAAVAVSIPEQVPTVLILDASGSMVRDVPGGGTRMDAARAAATTFVDGLSDGARLGLTVFGTTTGNADADQPAGCLDVTEVLPVGPVDKTQFNAAVAGIVESGFTPIGLALQRAAAQLPSSEPATIVLVSDGVDSCSPPPSCEIAASVKQSQPELTIHTIGFLVDADEEAQAQLACIAAVGGGEFVAAGNAAQLAARLRIASDPVSLEGTLTPTSFEGLRLGMTLKQAKAVEPSLTLGDTTIEYQYVNCDYATLRFANGLLDQIIPLKSVPTAEGLAINDDLGKAVQLYGEPTAPASDADGAFADFTATPGGANAYRVYFTPTQTANTGKVVRIILCSCGPKTGVASEAANWVIDFDGIGPVQLGQTFPEAFAGVPEIPGAWPEYCTWAASLDVPSSEAEMIIAGFYEDPAPTVYAISVDDYGPAGSVAASGAQLPHTWAGVGFGSTLSDVRAAHPGVSVVDWGMSDNDYWVLTGSNGNSLLFYPDESGRVRGITLATEPIPVYELCA